MKRIVPVFVALLVSSPVLAQQSASNYVSIPRDLGCFLDVASGGVTVNIGSDGTVTFPEGTKINGLVCRSAGRDVSIPLATDTISAGMITTKSFGTIKVAISISKQGVNSPADLTFDQDFSIQAEKLQGFLDYVSNRSAGSSPQTSEQK